MKNVVLIGMTGSFKSSAGRIVAEKTGLSFFDADDEYVKKYGEKIADTFSRSGEQTFRQRETEVLKELAAKKDCVIACGGGAVLREENMTALKENGVIIRLHADPSVLYKRISGDKRRPVTSGKSETELARLYEKRKPLYEKYGDFTVDNSSLSPEQTADKIISFLAASRLPR